MGHAVNPYWLIRMLRQIDYKLDALGRDQYGAQDWAKISGQYDKRAREEVNKEAEK